MLLNEIFVPKTNPKKDAILDALSDEQFLKVRREVSAAAVTYYTIPQLLKIAELGRGEAPDTDELDFQIEMIEKYMRAVHPKIKISSGTYEGEKTVWAELMGPMDNKRIPGSASRHAQVVRATISRIDDKWSCVISVWNTLVSRNEVRKTFKDADAIAAIDASKDFMLKRYAMFLPKGAK